VSPMRFGSWLVRRPAIRRVGGRLHDREPQDPGWFGPWWTPEGHRSVFSDCISDMGFLQRVDVAAGVVSAPAPRSSPVAICASGATT
jgi:hypothetical protein